MATKTFLLLAFFINFNELCLTFRHNIYISSSTGNNTFDCVKNSSLTCETLDYVLGIISTASKLGYQLRNSTKIQVQGNQFMQENVNLTGLYNFVLRGDSEGSEVRCNFSRGLIILSSKNIAVERVTFLHCGSRQRSENSKDTFFHVGVFFSNITNVNVTACVIASSTGIGMALLNVGGNVMFNDTYFTENINNSRSGSKIESGFAQVGGGLIIEIKYDSVAGKPSSSNNYIFYNCTFNRNSCMWNWTEQDIEREYNGVFGCGGGMAMTFKGQAQNYIELDHCNFSHNKADWGGGYFISFENKSFSNFVHFKNVTAESNYGKLSGGAGRFYLDPRIYDEEAENLKPNQFKQENCSYYHNHAKWGGAVSVFGTSASKLNHITNATIVFIKCHWENNHAVVGSALGVLSNPTELQEFPIQNSGRALTISVKLMNCEFRENNIHSNPIVGAGTIYVDETVITMENVFFTLNNGTPLVLDLSNVLINGDVNFVKNSGNEGGAIALYGRSKIILGKNSSLNFTSNIAFLRGGAIYSYSQGPNLRAFKVHLFDRSTCFFSYESPDSNIPPNNWSASVTFYNNTAPRKSGKSIYADTLQFCRNYGSLSVALDWKPFKYLNRTDDEPEIVTDPVKIQTKNSDWIGFPGQLLSPKVILLDEKGSLTNGLLRMTVKSLTGNVTVGSQVSPYIYISDGKSSVPILFESKKLKGDFELTLSSVYTQVIETTIDNITTNSCYGGFKFDENKRKCICLPLTERPYGYTRCFQDGKTIYLKKGYWATIGEDKEFLVMPCPLGYCKCANETKKNKFENSECVFTKFWRNSSQCKENRKGRLCGSCTKGYSVVVGLNDCKECSDVGLLWLLLIIVGLTLVVLVVVYFEIDFFSGPLNSWLYTYHIISLMFPYKSDYLDQFIIFVISLTNGQFDVSTGKCLWKRMDTLQKRTLEYLMPFYCTLLLYFINKVLRNFPNLPAPNRSFHHAFVTIVIVSYAALIQTTFAILNPVSVDGKLYVFEQADFEYFGEEHLPYAIPALLILLLIVIPFPFVIAFSSYFTKRFPRFRHLLPLFEALQSPYRPNRNWFASYYIFCRLVFISALLFRNSYEHTLFPFYQALCVIILLILVLLRPYNDENHIYFNVDTCFLSLLSLIISALSAMEANKEPRTVFVFEVIVRILVYVPLIYSLVLLIKYVYQKGRAYQQERVGRYEL